MRRIRTCGTVVALSLACALSAPLAGQNELVEAGLIEAGDWEQEYDALQSTLQGGWDSYEALLAVRAKFLEVAGGMEGGDQIMGPNLTVPNQLPAGFADWGAFTKHVEMMKFCHEEFDRFSIRLKNRLDELAPQDAQLATSTRRSHEREAEALEDMRKKLQSHVDALQNAVNRLGQTS